MINVDAAREEIRGIRAWHQPDDGSPDCRVCGTTYPCPVDEDAVIALDGLDALTRLAPILSGATPTG